MKKREKKNKTEMFLRGCGASRSGAGVCLVVFSDSARTGATPSSHPPDPTPPSPTRFLYPFSLKCLGYLAQSITWAKSNGCAVCLKRGRG